ncbi:MAG: flagellin [Armatimonadota bacterium]
MSFRINNNFAAQTAHSNLTLNADMLQASMGRLSSGLRITKASDDPSGLISSENLRSQIGSLEAAMRNNQDAVNYSKTAESALSEVNQLLSDARGLIIASGNTATLSSTQLRANQDQLASIASSITRIAQTAQFGSKRLLDGSSGIQAQVSAGNEVQGISLAGLFKGAPITSQGLMTLTSIVPGTQAMLTSATLTGGVILSPGSFSINGSTFSFTAGATGAQVAASVNAAASSTGVTAVWNTGTNQLDFNTTSYGQNAVLSFSDSSGVISSGPPTTVTGTNPIATISLGAMGSALFTGGRAGTDGLSLFDLDGNMVRLTSVGNSSAGYPKTIGQITPGSAVFQFGGNAGQTAQLTLPNMAASQLGNDVVSNMSMATLDITTPGNLTSALLVVDRAIGQVTSTRGQIGQFTNYVLESNNRSLQSAKENMTASESTIRDVDMASEMTAYTTYQVLQQSGMALLAQANQMPQTVLALLKG